MKSVIVDSLFVMNSKVIRRRGREYLLQHSPTLQEDLRGTTQREAVLEFVKLSNTVDDVPITVYRMKQVSLDINAWHLKEEISL